MRVALKIIITFWFTYLFTGVVYAQLIGIKTVGGTSPDYSTFADAVNALNTNGVGAGGVTFLFRDGTYTGGVEITSGGTSSDPIVFKSESEDSTTVIIELDAYDDVIDLNAVSYISFQDLSISYLKASAYSCVEIRDGASHITISNCVLQSVYTSTSNSGALIYGSETSLDCSDLLVENTYLMGGSYSVYFDMANDLTGPIIQDCILEDFYAKGIDLDHFTNISIDNNIIRTNSTYSSYGIDISYCSGQSEITNNYIYTTGSGQLYYGVNISSSSCGTSGTPAKFYNNSIQVFNGASSVYCVNHASGCNYWDIYNNTFYVSGGTVTTSYVYYCLASSANIKFKNNVLINDASGSNPYTLYAPNSGTMAEIDNNCYYATNSGTSFFGRFTGMSSPYDSYSSFNTATGETSSLNIDPEMNFVSCVGWKATASGLQDAGEYITEVSQDIDGKARVDPTSIGAHELATGLADDAGIVSVDSPEIPFAAGSHDVYVTLKNYGEDPLTSVNIEWEVNSVAQTVYNWTGNLANNETESVNIGAYSFIAGVVYELIINTDSPNSNTDGNNANDTASVNNLMPALVGTYSVGAAQDYTSIGDAVSSMQTYGVAGAVTFEIQTGTYNEQVSIPSIMGNNSSNTITFTSASGTNTDVTISYPSSTGIADNYTFQINGANYVTIQDLSIERTGTSNYAIVIDITGDSEHITLSGNIITGRAGGSGTSQSAIYSSNSTAGESNITISNNDIINGYYGIYIEGQSLDDKENIVIENNYLENYRYGIFLQYILNAYIDNNIIVNSSSYNSPETRGIGLFGVDEILFIRKNLIIKSEATSNYGIHMMSCVTEYGGPNDPGEISNNMIVVGGDGSGTSNGIYTNGTKNKNFYFNSIYTTGTNATTSKAMYVNGPYSVDPANNANFVFKNNVLMADYGIPMYNSVGGIISCDNNDYYSVNNLTIAHWDAAGDVESITELQAANSDDMNSISDDPLFVSDTDPFDLHINEGSPCIDNAVNITGITDDIDGDLRNPDIGADELDSPTPVEIISLGANCNNEMVILSWTTVSEINNDYFIVEKSCDARQFYTVGRVDGAGNSNSIVNYIFKDLEQTCYDSFYRLKQVDFNGVFKYSEIITINCYVNSEPIISVFPNPFDGRNININTNTIIENVKIEIYDATGRTMYKTIINQIDDNSHLTLYNKLKPGVYTIKLFFSNYISRHFVILVK